MNRQKRRRVRLAAVVVALTGLAMAGFSSTASAQAVPTATRALGFDAFGGVSFLRLDLVTTYKKYSPGFAVGADVTRHLFGFGLSIEPRFGRSTSSYDDQSYFLGDVKLEKKFGRFRPFGIGGIGYGRVVYSNGQFDNSVIYTVGPGVDYDLTDRWAVRGDWQYQTWNLGHETHGFNPNGVTAAVVYRFHLGRR